MTQPSANQPRQSIAASRDLPRASRGTPPLQRGGLGVDQALGTATGTPPDPPFTPRAWGGGRRGATFRGVPNRRMGGFLPVEPGPPAEGRAVDTVGAKAGHARVIGKRADFLVAGVAGDRVSQDQREPRPGAPLADAVRAAEEDHRRQGRRGREVRRPGVGADEEVGALQKRGGLGHGQTAGPVAEVGVRFQNGRVVGVLGTADHGHAPAVGEEAGDEETPVTRRPALGAGPRAEVDGQQRGRGPEPARVQPIGLVPAGGVGLGAVAGADATARMRRPGPRAVARGARAGRAVARARRRGAGGRPRRGRSR